MFNFGKQQLNKIDALQKQIDELRHELTKEEIDQNKLKWESVDEIPTIRNLANNKLNPIKDSHGVIEMVMSMQKGEKRRIKKSEIPVNSRSRFGGLCVARGINVTFCERNGWLYLIKV